MIWLMLFALLAPQEVPPIRRPSGRVGGPTSTPTETPTATSTPTPTPTPTAAGPCDHCPDPDSFACTISWASCVKCWADCGQPIATPTPIPPTRTPTRTPTPTLGPGECRFRLDASPAQPKEVYAVAYYLHESEDEPGTIWRANPPLVREGNRLRADTQGNPVAVEWYVSAAGAGEYELVSTCGVVPPTDFPLFADGFESGDTGRWR